MIQRFLRNSQNIFGLVLVLGCYLSVGCGPIYETSYSFTAPKVSQGKICVSHCENTRLLCEQNEEIKQEYCELRTERTWKIGSDCYGYRPFCRADYYRCLIHYKNCYQSCGGTVESQDVCVMGCSIN